MEPNKISLLINIERKCLSLNFSSCVSWKTKYSLPCLCKSKGCFSLVFHCMFYTEVLCLWLLTQNEEQRQQNIHFIFNLNDMDFLSPEIMFLRTCLT